MYTIQDKQNKSFDDSYLLLLVSLCINISSETMQAEVG